MKNYNNISKTVRTLNHNDWAGVFIYNQVKLQPSQKGGGTWT
jgi:hypothetical protein